MSTARLRFNLRNGTSEEMNTDHFRLILARDFNAAISDGVESLRIWRCFHGGMVISSHNVDGYDIVEMVDQPTPESVFAALKACLPKADESLMTDVLPSLAAEALAVPVPKPAPGEEARSELVERLTSVILDALKASTNMQMFTENPIIEIPDAKGELTVYMSGRGPLVINAAEWPVIGEEFLGIKNNVCISVRIRQHAQKGDLIIYGENRRFDKPRAIFAGELLVGPEARPSSSLPGVAIHSVTNDLMTDGIDRKLLANRLLAKLPSERL